MPIAFTSADITYSGVLTGYGTDLHGIDEGSAVAFYIVGEDPSPPEEGHWVSIPSALVSQDPLVIVLQLTGVLPPANGWYVINASVIDVGEIYAYAELSYATAFLVTRFSIFGYHVTITVVGNTASITAINLVNGGVTSVPFTVTPTTITFTIPTLSVPVTVIAITPAGPTILGTIPMNTTGSGGIGFGGSPEIKVTKSLSGIYTLVPDKLTDTFYDRLTGQTSIALEIPDPEFKTGYIGG